MQPESLMAGWPGSTGMGPGRGGPAAAAPAIKHMIVRISQVWTWQCGCLRPLVARVPRLPSHTNRKQVCQCAAEPQAGRDPSRTSGPGPVSLNLESRTLRELEQRRPIMARGRGPGPSLRRARRRQPGRCAAGPLSLSHAGRTSGFGFHLEALLTSKRR